MCWCGWSGGRGESGDDDGVGTGGVEWQVEEEAHVYVTLHVSDPR